MTDASDADLIRQLERDRLDALVTADLDRARELHADDYQLISAGGGIWSKESYLGSIASGDLRYHRFEPEGEISVRFYGAAAVVRYAVAIDVSYPGGREATRCWHTDHYELRDGRWQAVWSQATRIS